MSDEQDIVEYTAILKGHVFWFDLFVIIEYFPLVLANCPNSNGHRSNVEDGIKPNIMILKYTKEKPEIMLNRRVGFNHSKDFNTDKYGSTQQHVHNILNLSLYMWTTYVLGFTKSF